MQAYFATEKWTSGNNTAKMKDVVEVNSIKRGAWHYQKRTRPSFSAIFKSRADRQRFVRAWFFEPVSYVLDFVAHFVLKVLPIDICSDFGAFLGRNVMKLKHQEAVQNIRRNIEVLLPQLSLEEREAILTRNCESLGRLMTEFSVLTRICRDEKRVKVTGVDSVIQAAKSSPIILVALHLGNWEVLSSVSKRLSIPFHTFFLPLDNPVERWVTAKVRKKLGANLLPMGMTGVGPALRVLRQGGVVSLFCDEGFSGKIRGPLFGSPAHIKGNLALAVRLARRTGAKLCVVRTLRQDSAAFECFFSTVIDLPARDDSGDKGVLEDVRYLNGFVEPLIIQNLDQWYYLHNRL